MTSRIMSVHKHNKIPSRHPCHHRHLLQDQNLYFHVVMSYVNMECDQDLLTTSDESGCHGQGSASLKIKTTIYQNNSNQIIVKLYYVK